MKELLDIVDDLGNPTGEVIDRITAHQKGIQHRTSHVWVIRKKEEIELLLQIRSPNKDSYPNCLDISSAGHIPVGQDYKSSAVRELQEELGVQVSEEDLIEIGIRKSESKNIFHGNLFHNKQISKVFVVWYDQDEFHYQKEELAGTIWMPLENVIQLIQENLQPHCIKMEEIEMLQNYLK